MHNKINQFIKNPKKSLIKLAMPIMIGMLVQIMYNIVDTAFIGRLGAESIAALTFSFPIFFILMAINNGLSIGMSSRISRFLGEKNKKQAENTAMHGLLWGLVLGLIVMVLGLILLKPLFLIFGATEVVASLGINYMSIILLGVLFMFLSNIMINIFSAQGNTKVHMKIQISALVMNMILDPIFIYVLNLGVSGAAIASVISFFFALVLVTYDMFTKSLIKLRFSSFKLSKRIIKDIFAVGFPTSISTTLISIYIIFINRFSAHFGTEYVAAFGLASRLESVAVMPIMAISFAMITLVGMFYGAKKYEILKETVKYGIKISVIFTSCMGVVFFFLSKILLRIFTSDELLLSISSSYIGIIVVTFPMMAIGFLTSRVMQGMGFGLPGLVINLIRIFFVAVPLAYVFVFILGYGFLSIAAAMVVGGIVSSFVASVWLTSKLGRLKV